MKKIWQCIIQPHLDYASVLWQPVSYIMEIRKMELPLRNFTRMIPSLRNLCYSDGLKILKIQSQQRRSEQYLILYIRKMIIGKVPSLGIKVDVGTRYGNTVNIIRNKCSNEMIMKLRDDSLLVEGAKLYNSVPMFIRSYDGSYLGFKNLIDAWLKFIPYIPRVTGNEPEGRNFNGYQVTLYEFGCFRSVIIE